MIKVLTQTFGLFLAAFIAVSAFYYYAYAAPLTWTAPPTTVDMEGYAWSDTIGWISFNCNTGGPGGADICGTNSYKVTVDAADGSLDGYAWSDNIGWIKFGGLSGFPDGTHGNAYIENDSGIKIYGWARACSATDDGVVGTAVGDCSSMATDLDAGGWDGWISFHCSDLSTGCDPLAGGVDYGWRLTPSASDDISGYAWGGDVIGWIQSVLTVALPVPTITTFGAREEDSSDALETAFTMSSSTQPVEIMWAADNASECNETAGNGFDTGSLPNDTGTDGITEPNPNGYAVTYSIECINTYGASDTASLTVTNPAVVVIPTPTLQGAGFTAAPPVVRSGDTTDLSWEVDPTTIDTASGCRVLGQGTVVGSATGNTGTVTSGAVGALTEFVLECMLTDGSGYVPVPSGTVTVQTAGTREES